MGILNGYVDDEPSRGFCIGSSYREKENVMNNFKMDTTEVSDEGETIGKAGGYISNFKKLGMGDNTSAPTEYRQDNEVIITLPPEWKEDTEKVILTHYYNKLGNGSCEDFDKVALKIAEALNRAYKTKYLSTDVIELLKRKVTKEDLIIKKQERILVKPREVVKNDNYVEKNKIKINLIEGKYEFIQDLKPLTNEQLDLCSFINPESLCFSSDGYSFYLSVKPNKTKCFNNLFNFNTNEQMMFEIFKNQLGDEHTAKKLVLLSRNAKKVTTTRKIKKPVKVVKKKEDSLKKLF